MNKNVLLYVGGAGFLAVAAFLALFVFEVQKIWIDDKVSEGEAIFDSGATAAPVDDTPAPGGTGDATDGTTAQPTDESPEPDNPSTPVVETIKEGNFSNLGRYSVSGGVTVVTDGNQRFLSFDDTFASDNGPDLKVYLQSESGEIVDLGDLKGNIGDQNYEIPTDTDLDNFSNVVIWCERFSSGFGEATLANPAG